MNESTAFASRRRLLVKSWAPSDRPLVWITASAGKETRLIMVDDVAYFRADNKYTTVVTAEGEALLKNSISKARSELRRLEQEYGLEVDPDAPLLPGQHVRVVGLGEVPGRSQASSHRSPQGEGSTGYDLLLHVQPDTGNTSASQPST